jgi:hypothetical protein
MEICIPVAAEAPPGAGTASPGGPRRMGRLGVIDNSKPRFETLARSAVEALVGIGYDHEADHYVRKPSPTRPATDGEIERLGNGTVAVLIGSGD